MVIGRTKTFYILVSKCLLQCVLEENTREWLTVKNKNKSFKDLLR